jgi:hypothetical protein
MSTEYQNGCVNKYILSVLLFVQEMALVFTIVGFRIVEVEAKTDTRFTPENTSRRDPQMTVGVHMQFIAPDGLIYWHKNRTKKCLLAVSAETLEPPKTRVRMCG